MSTAVGATVSITVGAMASMATQDIDRRGAQAPGLPAALDLRFGGRVVRVRSGCGRATSALRAILGPMALAAGAGPVPSGADLAGTVTVEAADGLYRVRGRPGSPPSLPAQAQAAVADDPGAAARDAYRAALGLLIAARPDLLWLHAGAVARGGRALLLCGASGQGKSTLVSRLLRAGWDYLSDEIVPVDSASGCALPFPVVPYRRPEGGAALSEDEVRALPKTRVPVAARSIAPGPARLAAIVFPCYRPHDRRLEAQPRPPAGAAVELMRHSFGGASDRPAELHRACAVAAAVPAWSLHYSDACEAAGWLADLQRARGEPDPPIRPGP